MVLKFNGRICLDEIQECVGCKMVYSREERSLKILHLNYNKI